MPFHTLDPKDLIGKMSPVTRLLLHVFRRRLNHELMSPFLCRAHERGVINSHQMHEMAKHFDPTQKGLIGQL